MDPRANDLQECPGDQQSFRGTELAKPNNSKTTDAQAVTAGTKQRETGLSLPRKYSAALFFVSCASPCSCSNLCISKTWLLSASSPHSGPSNSNAARSCDF